MRIVLETNLLMSGIFFSGPPAAILAAWSEGRLDLVASVDILVEYRRVDERLRRKCPSIAIDPILDLVTTETHIVRPATVPASGRG